MLFRSGTALTVRNSERDFKVMCGQAGIVGVRASWHTLRHSFAVNYLFAKGRKPVLLAADLGALVHHHDGAVLAEPGNCGFAKGERWVIIADKMTPEQKQGWLEHVQAVKALDDDTLLAALYFGYRNPNLDPNSSLVKGVLESRLLTKISDGTKELAQINDESKVQILRLVKSSLIIESLTKWLVGLTVVLAFLTLALVVDVGIKFQHEYYSRLPQLSVPQTPGRPPG